MNWHAWGKSMCMDSSWLGGIDQLSLWYKQRICIWPQCSTCHIYIYIYIYYTSSKNETLHTIKYWKLSKLHENGKTVYSLLWNAWNFEELECWKFSETHFAYYFHLRGVQTEERAPLLLDAFTYILHMGCILTKHGLMMWHLPSPQ